MKTADIATRLIERIEARDIAIVDLCGYHAEECSDIEKIGEGNYYLAHGSVWVGGSYAAVDGKLRNDSPGDIRMLIADLLDVDSQLDKIHEAVALQAGRNEQRAASLVS